MMAINCSCDNDYYNEQYYQHQLGHDYNDREHWLVFFGNIAEHIESDFHPKKVLDAGCAYGYLVAALRDRKVNAYGIDISEYAISRTRDDIKEYCRVQSAEVELNDFYDLIVTIEMLEHVPAETGEAIIANICRHTNVVIFSSTPDDVKEPSHFNVQRPDYWAKLFAKNGFYKNLQYDATYISQQACCFVKIENCTNLDIIANYEKHVDELEIKYISQIALLQTQLDISETDRALLERERESLLTKADVFAVKNESLSRKVEVFTVKNESLSERLNCECREKELINQQYKAILSSTSWRFTSPIRIILDVFKRTTHISAVITLFRKGLKSLAHNGLKVTIRKITKRLSPSNRASDTDPLSAGLTNEDWEYLRGRFLPYKLSDIEEIKRHVAGNPDLPQISVLMPVYNTNIDHLRAAIQSVRNQIYSKWELVICDDASPGESVRTILNEVANTDHRIHVVYRNVNGNISEASNSALEVAMYAWCALMDHDDLLEPSALYFMACAIAEHPNCQMLYSDEDTFNEEGKYNFGYLKPEWDPILILQQNYFSHLGVFKTDLLRSIGGFRKGFEGSQDWDVVLRCSQHVRANQIVHVPLPLYHWRRSVSIGSFSQSQLDRCLAAGRKAVQEHLFNLKLNADVQITVNAVNKIIWEEQNPYPLVSVIITFKDKAIMTEDCIIDLLATDYPNLEILAIDNGSVETETIQMESRFTRIKNIQFIRDNEPFSHSRLNNMAAKKAHGEFLLFLNNDTRMPDRNWLKELLGWSQWPGVGAIGLKLLYPDGKVQHGGVFVSNRRAPGHLYILHNDHTTVGSGRLDLVHYISAITGACLLVKKSIFEQVGEFDESFATSYNDVDLCLKIERAGYRNLYVGTTHLVHFESASRQNDPKGEHALQQLCKKWGDRFDYDSALHPLLARPSCFGVLGADDAPHLPKDQNLTPWKTTGINKANLK